MNIQILPDSLGNVAKCVDGGPPDSFLVGLQQLQQLKANPHPLPGRDVLRSCKQNGINKRRVKETVPDPEYSADPVLAESDRIFSSVSQ
jgi:hypothetical protein